MGRLVIATGLTLLLSVAAGCDAKSVVALGVVDAKEEVVELPVVDVWVGMTTQEARERAPQVLGKLSTESGFDTWQPVYLNTPVRFIYRDDVAGFTIERPHAFTISPNSVRRDGTIWAITLELEPMFESNLDGAFALGDQWCRFFASKDLQKPDYAGLDITMERGGDTKDFRRDMRMKGVTLCDWEKGGVIYSVGVERFGRSIVDRETDRENKVPVYKVAININHRSVFEPYKITR